MKPFTFTCRPSRLDDVLKELKAKGITSVWIDNLAVKKDGKVISNRTRYWKGILSENGLPPELLVSRLRDRLAPFRYTTVSVSGYGYKGELG